MNKFLFYKYFSGQASEGETKLILNYTEESVANNEEFLAERKLWDIYTFHGEEDKYGINIQSRRKIIFKIAKIAAIFCIAFTSSLFILSHTQTVSEQKIIVPAGQRVQVILSDSTVVWLNANTTFSYPSNFGSDDRTVALVGEGYFEVKKDKKKPFIVQTPRYNIKVTGTIFDVKVNREATVFDASLFRGGIEIQSEKDNTILQMRPNESVFIDKNNLLTKVSYINSSVSLWKDGLLCFDDELFSSIIDELQNYYGVNIEINNESLKNYRCTAKFREDIGLVHILKIIQKNVNFKFHFSDDKDQQLIIN